MLEQPAFRAGLRCRRDRPVRTTANEAATLAALHEQLGRAARLRDLPLGVGVHNLTADQSERASARFICRLAWQDPTLRASRAELTRYGHVPITRPAILPGR